MTLPTEPTPAVIQDPRILLLYGSPKVGKTTKLAELKNCLVIDLEDGTDYIPALKVKVNNFIEFKSLCLQLKQKPMLYNYIAIDTITKLEEWAEVLATLNYKASAIGKNFTGSTILTLPQGGGYLWLRMAFKELIEQLSGTTSTVILMGHLREKMLESVGGKEVSVKDIELTGKIRAITCAMADAVGYIFRSSVGKLMISFKTSEQVLCGSRCEHLKGKEMEFNWEDIFLGSIVKDGGAKLSAGGGFSMTP